MIELSYVVVIGILTLVGGLIGFILVRERQLQRLQDTKVDYETLSKVKTDFQIAFKDLDKLYNELDKKLIDFKARLRVVERATGMDGGNS